MTTKAKIKKIAELRDLVAKTNIAIDAQQEVIDQLPEAKTMVGLRATLASHANDLAGEIVMYKNQCVAAFEETEEKEYPGGKIKQVTGYSYDGDRALKWVLDHNHRSLVSLNTKAFRDVCKTMMKPDFVLKDVVPKFYMDGDLSKFL